MKKQISFKKRFTRKRLTLPRSTNGNSRKTATLSVYQEQKDELFRKATARGMSVSYYLNWLLWNDWMMAIDPRVKELKLKVSKTRDLPGSAFSKEY